MVLRVVQWASGNVGKHALRAIASSSELDLVGLYVRSPDKVGLDAGEICGLERRLGVAATSSLDDILALEADCVLHTPLPSLIYGDRPEVDENDIVRLLESGKNVITTVGYLYPKAYGGQIEQRLSRAAMKGGVSLHGTGLNPGFLGDLLPLTLSAMSRRIDRLSVLEISDFGFYPSPEIMMGMMRMGLAPDEFERTSERLRHWLSGLFRETVMIIADGLDAHLDEIVETYEIALADKPIHAAAGLIDAGTVAGQHWRWSGVKDGRERILHETVWRMHADVAPHWPQGANRVLIEGEPRMQVDLPAAWLTDGLAATAFHAVNAVPAVCNAPPGLRSFLDLPLMLGRGTLR